MSGITGVFGRDEFIIQSFDYPLFPGDKKKQLFGMNMTVTVGTCFELLDIVWRRWINPFVIQKAQRQKTMKPPFAEMF